MLTLFNPRKAEEKLLERCRNQDRAAQFEMYQKYAEAMLRVAFQITHDEDEAQDVLQESFIRAFNKLDQFEGQSTFGAWLKRIVVNQSLNLVQRRTSLVYLDEFPEELDSPSEEISWDDVSDDMIRTSIDALPDGYRVVLSLYLLEGYDHEEIAEILGIGVSTSKSQYSRAKARLRTELKAYYNETRR